MATDTSIDHEYLPIDGLPSFTSAMATLAFGKESPALAEKRVSDDQSLYFSSEIVALRVLSTRISHQRPNNRISLHQMLRPFVASTLHPHIIISKPQVVSCQSLSGTGGLRVVGEFLGRFYPQSKTILVPAPTWGMWIGIELMNCALQLE